jgi:pSer/pThr/pTyr-binding forkhead associated (FHA) protein
MLKIQFKDRRKPAMWLVDSTLKIGSDPSCNIVVEEASVDPIHVELVIQQNEIVLKNVSTNRSVFINDIPVVKEHLLKSWDVLKVGESELEIIDPLSERNPPPVKKPDQATVIRPIVSPWMLKAESAPLGGQYFSLSNGFIIGRDEKSDIKLPFSYVSRNHSKIAIRKEKLFIEDLNSSNGTYINGEKIKSCEVRNGDELRLDQFVFHVIGPVVEGVDRPRTIVRSNTSKPKTKSSTMNSNQKDAMASHKVFLHGLSDDVHGKVYEIIKSESHISKLLGHHLSTSEKSVSARHVYLNETDVGWEIKNDGAADGLLVNGKMQSRVIIDDGDEIIVGGTLLKFQSVGDLPLNYAQPKENNSGGGKGLAISVIVIALGTTAAAIYFSGLLN